MKGKDGNGMDTIVIILLIVIIVIAALAALVMINGKWNDIHASRYVREVQIDKEYDGTLIREAKVLIVGKMAFITKGIDGKTIIYDQYPIDDTGTPISGTTIDGKKITQHQLASRLVDDSITARGVDGVKLLTADEWEVLGHKHDDHKDALAYLMPLGVVKVQGGKAGAQGTYVKKGETLQTLLRDLAVYALPLATGQSISVTKA